MNISEFYEAYDIGPGEYNLDVVLPDGRKCQFSLVVNYMVGINHHDVEIFDYHHGEEMPEHVVKYWFKDVSDWLIDDWKERYYQ